MLYFHTRLKKPRDRGSAARNVKVGFSSGSSPFTVVALRQAYSMVKATLSPPRAFQSVKNRESGAFGGKFGKAPMQEEESSRPQSTLPDGLAALLSGESFGTFRTSCDPISVC
jgi:hypothetical protein